MRWLLPAAYFFLEPDVDAGAGDTPFRLGFEALAFGGWAAFGLPLDSFTARLLL